MDPKKLDRGLLKSLVEKYGDDDMAAELARRDGWPSAEEDNLTGGMPVLDDFAACKIARKEDWVDLYARPYFFGCEADDRMNVTAFGKANPFGARINAIFSSDIGHFDVPNMLSPVPEAYELVEDELITPSDFRDFTFANAVRLWGQQNPRFFEGTRVAKAAQVERPVKRITLRDSRSRWGSCGPHATLSFSWRLVFAPPEVLDYLAAHEVAHLVHLNHGPHFWALARALCDGPIEAPQAWLKKNGEILLQYGA